MSRKRGALTIKASLRWNSGEPSKSRWLNRLFCSGAKLTACTTVCQTAFSYPAALCALATVWLLKGAQQVYPSQRPGLIVADGSERSTLALFTRLIAASLGISLGAFGAQIPVGNGRYEAKGGRPCAKRLGHP